LKTARSTSDDDCKHPGERRERTGTAGLVIFALSALCWLPLMLPFVVFGRL
jgi:hypothetical protein